MKHLYILRNGEPVAVDDILEWAEWFEARDTDRQVLLTRLSDQGHEHTRVSTCFLGTDHNFTGVGPPILWETAVFHNTPDPERRVSVERRYTSRLDAIAGHHRIVAEIVERAAASQGRRPEVIETKETN